MDSRSRKIGEVLTRKPKGQGGCPPQRRHGLGEVPLRSQRRQGPGVGDPGRLRQHGQRMPPGSLTNNQKQFQHLGVQRRCFRQCIGTCGTLVLLRWRRC